MFTPSVLQTWSRLAPPPCDREENNSKNTVSLNLLWKAKHFYRRYHCFIPCLKCLWWESEARSWLRGRSVCFQQVCLLPKTASPMQVLSGPCPADLPRSDSIWSIQGGLATDTSSPFLLGVVSTHSVGLPGLSLPMNWRTVCYSFALCLLIPGTHPREHTAWSMDCTAQLIATVVSSLPQYQAWLCSGGSHTFGSQPPCGC